ncbi:molybdopterin molybdotransferase MoeA [Ottowia sp. GY511]|uniref:Molybdopterin molybdenumtransferase n=1 Tax=Ottowia flava TaxID=2675430 RepID=A0ABW4L2G9_9BURK|nr:molybdopterin molybdotransferase MoeA [Ottowia sp. GY511]TXK22545.1 molybdopterin molybdotransferase MoeA [Ottowia sp. GY511]
MKSIEQIAAELQGYDPKALPADTVNAFLAELVEPVTDVERLPLMQALGRVLAEDIVSPISVPPHDNSAMDGFAFRGTQLAPGQPLTLRVVGTALAGAAWRGEVGPGECVKIMTGAVMPEGLDTVVPQEFARVDGDAVEIPANVVRLGDNRRHLGEDLMAGQAALQKGELLAPAALGLVASLGIESVHVLRRVRVAYFSTGDEILSLGEAPREGAVYDSNRYTVFGLLTRLGCEVIDLGVVPDDPAQLEAAFRQAAARADAVITSGGVSVGEADHTKAMMRQLGDVVFWRIAMRPGRPMAVGRIPRSRLTNGAAAELSISAKSASGPTADCAASYPKDSNAVLFGLPGNPVAVMVTFLAFVRPALLRLMGARPQPTVYLRAASAEPIRKKPGRTEYQRGIVARDADGRLTVRTTGNQGSGVLSSMVQANGLIVLGHAQGNVAAGDLVEVMMFDGAI